MPSDLSTADLRNENIQFYKELVEKYKFQQGHLLALFPELRQAGFFEKYFPSNSHEALGISTKETYDLRRQAPMVYIEYSASKQGFVVYYQNTKGVLSPKNTVGRLCPGKSLQK